MMPCYLCGGNATKNLLATVFLTTTVAITPAIAEQTRHSTSVPIEYINGAPTVQILISGRAPLRCLLDTGADVLTIPYTMIEQLNQYGLDTGFRDIQWLAGPKTLGTAGGGTISTGSIRIHAIDIGQAHLTNVPAAVTRQGDCLLGMSVLKVFGHPTIDFANSRLILAE